MLVIEKKYRQEKRQFPLKLDASLYDRIRKYSFDKNISMNCIITDMIKYSLSNYIDKGINKLALLDFIEELKHNATIPNTNNVRIDYVIIRLKNLFEEE